MGAYTNLRYHFNTARSDCRSMETPPSKSRLSYCYRTLLIHGTFSAPSRGGGKWHESGSTFSESLKRKLEGTHLEGSVRSSDDPAGAGFSWSGVNGHFERIAAAEKLRDFILEQSNNDRSELFNFIAHSHGGNVLLKTIELIHDEISSSCHNLCQLIKPSRRRQISDDELDGAIVMAFGDMSECKVRTVRDEFLRAPTITFGTGRPRGSVPKTTVDNYHLQQRLFENPKFHGIGSCVFVGTPFFHVRERMPYSHAAFKVLAVLLALGLLIAVSITVAIVAELTKADWLLLILFPLMLWGAVVGLGSLSLSFSRSNYNLYFYEGSGDIRRQINSINKEMHGSIPALSINSSLFDEVFIAFKNFDFLWGKAQAQIGSLVDLGFPKHRRLTDDTFVGRRIRLVFSPWIQVAEFLSVAFRIITFPIALAVTHLAKKLVLRRLKKALGERILGLNGVYMSPFVDVTVSSQIGEGTIFKEVSEDVLDSDIKLTLNDTIKHFDPQNVKNEMAASIIRKVLPRRSADGGWQKFVPLEQKLEYLVAFSNAVASTIELSHSRYFDSDRIATSITEFLKINSSVH